MNCSWLQAKVKVKFDVVEQREAKVNVFIRFFEEVFKILQYVGSCLELTYECGDQDGDILDFAHEARARRLKDFYMEISWMLPMKHVQGV